VGVILIERVFLSRNAGIERTLLRRNVPSYLMEEIEGSPSKPDAG